MGNDKPVTRSDIDDSAATKYDEVAVSAPARLHLGFLDLNGDLGRRYGGLGIALDDIRTRIRVRPSAAISGYGPSSVRAVRYAERLLRALDIDHGVQIVVEEAIPEHVGLGSGTQLALAVGTAISTLFGLRLGPRKVAPLLDRGGRSGIGLSTFENGGVVLDGGQGAYSETPPILCRFDFPAAWRIVVVFDHHRQGLHDTDEHLAFRNLPPFPAELSGKLCRLAVMGALPALAETDIKRFGSSVTSIQEAMGDFFASIQGHRFSSQAVAEAIEWLRREGGTGVGQSSWGPAGFAFVRSESEAIRLVRAAEDSRPAGDGVELMICKGCNTGAKIEYSVCADAQAKT